MTKEWEAGDFAMIGPIGYIRKGYCEVGSGLNTRLVHLGTLRPLPTAMTDAEKALVEHVVGVDWRGSGGQIEGLSNAVLAERAPPDPVEVAWALWAGGEGLPVPQDFRAALKAYDAAKGDKS